MIVLKRSWGNLRDIPHFKLKMTTRNNIWFNRFE